MIVHIHWTMTRENEPFRIRNLDKHQTAKRKEITNGLLGGLGFQRPLFTRVILKDGRLFPLMKEDKEIHIALEGGLTKDFRFRNTATSDQLLSLANELRSLIHTHRDIEVISNNFINFDTDLWAKAIGIQ